MLRVDKIVSFKRQTLMPQRQFPRYSVIEGSAAHYLGPLVCVDYLPGQRPVPIFFTVPPVKLLVSVPLRSLLLILGMECLTTSLRLIL